MCGTSLKFVVLIVPTCIASKCDDISCGEVIRALNLEEDPELEDIENRIEQNSTEAREWKDKKADAEKMTQCK